jgi:thioredoxin reductase (NADPH)
MELFDLTVLGGGPTGMFASIYAGMREMKTKLIEALPEEGGQLAVLYPEKYIYDVAGYPKVLAKDLVKSLIEQGKKFRPAVFMGENAVGLRRNQDGTLTLVTDKGEHVSRTLIIAAGVGAFSPNKLGVQAEEKYDGRGLYYFVKDKNEFRGKNILVVGGGDSAIDWALGLKDWARQVTLIHRRDVFRAHESSVTQLFSSDVSVKLFYELKEIMGNGKVEKAVIYNNRTKDQEVLDIDAILVNVGFRADLGPIGDWGLTLDARRIKVNQRMETNIPGVFAAGDIASPDGLDKLTLIATGFAQATIAVNYAKRYVDPRASVHPGHSSEKKL